MPMKVELALRFYVRSDNEYTEVKDSPELREKLTQDLRTQVKMLIEEAAISTPAGVVASLDGVWEDAHKKLLDEVRKILRTPEGVSVTDHALQVMKGGQR